MNSPAQNTTGRSSESRALEGTDVPLTEDEVLEALSHGRVDLFNDLRARFPDWIPRLPKGARPLLRGKDLSAFDLSSMSLVGFDLRDCSFEGANLKGTDFSYANLARARIITRLLRQAQFTGTKHLYGRSAAILPSITTPLSAELDHEFMRELHLVITHDPWDFLPWSVLASIQKLRIFVVSYVSILLITAYAYAIKWINSHTDAYRDWAMKVSSNCEAPALQWLCVGSEIPAYPGTGRQLLMLIFLAIAATIYLFFCPAEIKENTRSRWVFELKQNVIYHRAADYSRVLLRYVCGALYTVGGLYTAWVVWDKVWGALVYLL